MNSWGIDSSGTFSAVYPAVLQRLGKPAFIGRYLYQLVGISDGLTAAEVTDIHAAGLALLLIYNGATIGSVRGGYAEGMREGTAAARMAANLWAPKGVAIIADIEANMYPTPEWLWGFVMGVFAAGYAVGFYGNANVQAFVTAYQMMRTKLEVPCYFWASEPELNEWFDTVRTDFTPLSVPGYSGDAVFHQYSENNLGGIADLDVCNDLGWTLLWHATPLVQHGTVIQDCAIKHFPSHQGPGLHVHGGSGVEYVLKAGTVVVEDAGQTPHWREITTDDKYHGWILRDNLRVT